MKDNADLRKLTSLLMLNDRNQTEALLAIYGIEARMHPEFTSSFFDVTGTSFLFRTIRDKARLDVLKNHPMLVRLDPDPNDNSIEFRWPTSVLDARRALGMVFPEFLDDKQWAAFVNQWSKLMNAEEPDVFTPEAAPEPAKAETKKKLTKKKDEPAPTPAPKPAPEPAKAEPAKPAEKKAKKKEEKPEPPKAEAKGKKPKKAEPEDSFDVDLGGDEPNTQSAEDALLQQAGAAASAGDYEAAAELTTEANAVAGHGPEPDEDEARLPAGNLFDDETAIETASAFADPAPKHVDAQPEPEPEPEPKAKQKSKAPKSPFPEEPRPKWYQRFSNFASYANEELFRMVAMLNECLTASRDGFPKEQLEALKDAVTRLAAKTAQEAFKGQALDEPDMDPMVGLTIINVKNQVQASLRDLELNPASPEQWEKFQKSMSEVKDMGKSAQKIFGQDGAASMIQQPPRLKDERGVPIVS